MKHIKYIAVYLTTSTFVFIINFGIYNYSFNTQATPFLHEEQRVSSALMMMKMTLPAYLIASLLLTFILFLIGRRLGKSLSQ